MNSLLVIVSFLLNTAVLRTEHELRAEIEARVKQWARERGFDSIAIEFRNAQIPSALSANDYAYRIVDDGTIFRKGRVNVPVEVRTNGLVRGRFFVPLVIHTYESVLVTQRTIQRGERLTRANCSRSIVETTGLPNDILSDYGEVETLVAARIISEKSVLTRSMCKELPVLQPQDIVTLRVRTGSVLVSTQAVVKEEGYPGKIITVQRIDTQQKYRARVLDRQTVEIETTY